MTRRVLVVSALVAASLIALPAVAALHDPVISSNEPRPFPQNGQNEPSLALDRTAKPRGPRLVAAGNDYRDQHICSQANCGFMPGIGISGLYYTDDGSTWIRSSYARPAGASTGPAVIRTLPNFPSGMWSFGDPAVAAGPRRVGSTFSWTLGTRFYYATLAATASQPDRVITVSFADPSRRAAQVQPKWSKAKRISPAAQSADKPAIWADDAARSSTREANPNFGHVYACWTGDAGIMFARSVDGGANWTMPLQISPTTPSDVQGCTIRTDAAGRVYVFWRERIPTVPTVQIPNGVLCAKLFKTSIQMAESSDGLTFAAPSYVVSVREPGNWDHAQSQCTGDGVTGARINSFPSADIANGAPGGAGPNTIALATTEGPSDSVVVRTSHDRGASWSAGVVTSRANDNAAFGTVALAPNGSRIYLVYTAFLQGWQQDTAGARSMQAVVRTVPLKSLEEGRGVLPWAEVDGAKGDARASANFEGGDADERSVREEFLGDYLAIVATNAGAYAAWTDVSAAADCAAVDTYRGNIARGKEQALPNLKLLCKPMKGAGGLKTTFGNTTLCGVFVPARVPPGMQETKCASDLHP